MADLTQEQWSEQLKNDDNAVIIDVRTDAEFEEGYIPGAVQIDIYNGAEFLKRVKELDTQKNYYVYCRSGGRSGQACMLMNSIGIKNAYNLKGGIMEWDGEITD
ncbi:MULTISPECIES: rhodanese-like domain-containing protein [Aequorivita]|uniref:Rhodanese-like domain-containing protein n=1 Tax=Aequorivita iocasae TaxID=2803865 RepID=A0ABX7DU74_9FLAO|nr:MULTISPECIES: rhodanese-like domain-containing protein [Aequorivita]QQX77108.1 rhodanese-like domain-containing protein [Aequorivita iocasae]UCA56593.1 rhodanese-like domain-containing protein [Aequorivita sp. F7]